MALLLMREHKSSFGSDQSLMLNHGTHVRYVYISASSSSSDRCFRERERSTSLDIKAIIRIMTPTMPHRDTTRPTHPLGTLCILPQELRDRIWMFVLAGTPIVYVATPTDETKPLQILHCCKSLRREVLAAIERDIEVNVQAQGT